MKWEEVVKIIGENKIEDFKEFMRGQTIGINKDGTLDYYEQDVENFLRPVCERFFD
jgi:hypothetical protein